MTRQTNTKTKTLIRLILILFSIVLIIISINYDNIVEESKIIVTCSDGSEEIYNNKSHFESDPIICGNYRHKNTYADITINLENELYN